MRRALFLAYHFPPIGGAGVQRTLKFMRYLPEFGYQPVVVTGPGETAGRWTPVDETLAKEVSVDAEVVRVTSPAPALSRGWRARGERWLRLERPFTRWWIGETVRSARTLGADVVYASMSPYESGEAAAQLASALGRPWVADLRDPWALDEMQVYPSRVHRALELRRMRSLLASASAVVMNTPEAARRLAVFPEFAGRRVVSITNGFDPADFAGAAPAPEDDAFRIVHAGYLHTELGRGERFARAVRRILGGVVPGVDILTRSHVFLLEAIERVRAEAPELGGRVELHLAGIASPGDRKAAADASGVRFLGYLSHQETVQLMRSADLLFLPMQDLPAGTRATIVPGKTYEYLAAGPPILAAVPDGDARDLLGRAGHALLCRPADVDCMAAAIRGQLERRERGEPPARAHPDVARSYERRRLTERLAAVFDEVLSESPPSG